MNDPYFVTKIATTPEEIVAAQRLRYAVFISEMGGSGPDVDHSRQLERDYFDSFAQHLLLLDMHRPAGDRVVGVYRMMTKQMARKAGRFYCEDEYDLGPLYGANRNLLELGRSCLHRDYRGGAGMLHLWAALAEYIDDNGIDIVFGVASFRGTDISDLAAPLSLLHQRHLAPENLRVTAKGPDAVAMDIIPSDALDRVAAVRQIPALIKAYLRLGGTVGQGAFVDHAFRTTDICLILEKQAIGALGRAIYASGGKRG